MPVPKTRLISACARLSCARILPQNGQSGSIHWPPRRRKLGPASVFVDLDCTSPLRWDSDVDEALDQFEPERPDMLMSCCAARKNPYFNLVEPDEAGALRVSKPLANHVVARQQAPVVYEHAASTYVLDPAYLKSATSLFEGRVLPFLMPSERCMDIDSELDFKIVEFLMKEQNCD